MSTEYSRETAALDAAIPASNTADSVNDILLDQIKPVLPAAVPPTKAEMDSAHNLLATPAQVNVARKGVEFTLIFPIRLADGSLVAAAAGLDSEISKDKGNFADCTNEATAIEASGFYYLTLTAAEMNADKVAVIVKTTTTGAVYPCISIYTL